MGMFGEAADDPLWHGIAYAAGTGGSMIILDQPQVLLRWEWKKLISCGISRK